MVAKSQLKQSPLLSIIMMKPFENVVAKGASARNQHFPPIQTVLPNLPETNIIVQGTVICKYLNANILTCLVFCLLVLLLQQI